jgi:MFS family permease
MDVRPLRESPAFRRLLTGVGLSATGSSMTGFAVVLQVFTLTHSSLAVGTIGIAMAVPAIVFGLVGGSLADARDRRRLVLFTSSCLAAVSATFAVQAFAGNRQVWPLYVLVTIQSLVSSVDNPARRTFLPRLLPAHLVSAGAALNGFAARGSVIIGPSLAGLIAAAWGLKACYLVDVVSFGAALYGVARLPPMPPQGVPARPGLRAVADALRFIAGSRILTGALLADLSAMVLGVPTAVFPAINVAHFGGATQTLGLIAAAPGVGGVLGTVLSGSIGRVSRQGRAMLVTGSIWGACVAGFGLAHSLWLALPLLAVSGGADLFSVVFRTTMVQLATPDRYRGRAGAAEYVVGVGGPRLGDFRSGAVGSLTSPTISAVSGGLSVIVASAVIAVAIPAFFRYRATNSVVVGQGAA